MAKDNKKIDDIELDKVLKGDIDAFIEDNKTNDKKDKVEVEDVTEELKLAEDNYKSMKKAIRKQDYSFTDLTEHQLEVARKVADTLNEKDLTQLTSFGVLAQQQMGEFSEDILAKVHVNDMKGLETNLIGLMDQLQTTKAGDLKLNKPSQNFLQKFFKPKQSEESLIRNKYEVLVNSIDEITDKLVFERDMLLDDVNALEELYTKNKGYYTSTNVFIAAGMMKLKELVEECIPEKIDEAIRTGSSGKVQEVNDLVSYMNRLEKRIYDLKLTRQMSIQQAPQIKLAQEVNQQLAEKINSSINIAIPAWKNQISLATTLGRQTQALEMQQKVSDTTNKLLRQNADLIHNNTVVATEEIERGVVDLETLDYTQEKLIDTFSKMIDAQREGRKKRTEAENRLIDMSEDLRKAMLHRLTNIVEDSEVIDVTPADKAEEELYQEYCNYNGKDNE